jgi:hypothetical protein
MIDLDHRIELLTSSRSDVVNSIDRLKRRRAELMKELGQIEQDLVDEGKKLVDFPITIATMQEQKNSIAE